MNSSFINSLGSIALAALARSAQQTQFTVLGECPNLALLTSSLHPEHMLEPVMALKSLLNFLECTTYQSTSTYTPDIAEDRPRSKLLADFGCCWLLRTSTTKNILCCAYCVELVWSRDWDAVTLQLSSDYWRWVVLTGVEIWTDRELSKFGYCFT
jgi:hypothetical protein